MRFQRPTKKQEKQAEQEQKLRQKYIWKHFPQKIIIKGINYGIIGWGNDKHMKSTMLQYREVAPKGTYIYKRRHGIGVWYKKGHYV